MNITDLTVDLSHPPKGVWFRRDAHGFELGSTTRKSIAFFLVPFAAVWSGFTLGISYLLIRSGQFDLKVSLFGIAFAAFAVFLWGAALSTIWGRVFVAVQGNEGKLFNGIGPIGRTRKFKWNAVHEVRESTVISPNQNRYPRVVLKGDTSVSFGAGIRKDRLNFMRDALCAMLAERISESG